MNKILKENLSKLQGQDSVEQFLEIFELPDAQFNLAYPKIMDALETVFKGEELRENLIKEIAGKNIDIEEEKASLQNFINGIDEDETLSKNKKNCLKFIMESVVSITEELIRNPRTKIPVKIKKLSENATIPTYAHDTDAGADVSASENVTLAAGETKIIPTGIQIEIPSGYEVQLRARSGLSYKTGLRIANGVGTIDSSYRGPVGVIFTNIADEPYEIKIGDKIAQMVIAPTPMISFEEVEKLSETERGEGGFGSTDKKDEEVAVNITSTDSVE